MTAVVGGITNLVASAGVSILVKATLTLLVTLLGQTFRRARVARVPAQRGLQKVLARGKGGIEMVSQEIDDGWGREAGGRHKVLRYSSCERTEPLQATRRARVGTQQQPTGRYWTDST